MNEFNSVQRDFCRQTLLRTQQHVGVENIRHQDSCFIGNAMSAIDSKPKTYFKHIHLQMWESYILTHKIQSWCSANG